MKFSVFDLHCDTALELLGNDRLLRRNHHHIDLERAKALPGYAQCFACFTTPMMEEWGMGKAEDIFARELDVISRDIENNADLIS